MSVATATARTFRSLQRHRNYRLWFSGQLVSNIGTWVQNVGQAWYVVQLTNSPLAVGLLALFQFGPFAILGLFGGVVVDRLEYRKIIMVTQTLMMLSATTLAVLALSGHGAVWQVYVLATVNGLIQVVDMPARQAFTIQMVGRDELPNAVALNSSMFNASRVIGPGVGGLLIAAVGVGMCFLANAVSYIAVLAGLWAMRPQDFYKVEQAQKRNVIGAIGEGLRYSWRNSTTRTILGLMLVMAAFGMNFNVLVPILTKNTLHLGPEVFGLLSAAFGGGALIGALTAASIGKPNWRLLLGAAGAFAALLVVLAPLTAVWLCAPVLVLLGVAFSLYTASSNTSLQLTVPDRLRGRVMAVYGYVFIGTAPLGGLFAGWLADTGGTRLAYLVAGGASLIGVVAAVVTRPSVRLRLLRRRRVIPDVGSAIVRE